RVTTDVAFADHPRLKCDIYEPERDVPAHAPVAHFIYGGRWDTGEKACYRAIGAALASRGIRTVIGDYRLYPDVQFPEPNRDMAAAYAFTANRFGRDAPPPVIIGHSAGAHIGALLVGDKCYLDALPAPPPRPSAFVGLAGPYAFDPTTWDTTAAMFASTRDDPDRARPIAFADATFPPSLLLHGRRDDIVTPNASELFHDALLANGHNVSLKLYTWLNHVTVVMAMARPLRWVTPVLGDVAAFVETHAVASPRAGAPPKTAEAAPSA
ncbi:MAG: alpha/beta hydrolase, partial [Pseudomonadota bacterium]